MPSYLWLGRKNKGEKLPDLVILAIFTGLTFVALIASAIAYRQRQLADDITALILESPKVCLVCCSAEVAHIYQEKDYTRDRLSDHDFIPAYLVFVPEEAMPLHSVPSA